jgi:hypothetical protein
MRCVRGISQRARRWEGAVYEKHKDVDGFIYASRLTGDDCIAVFDRAVGKLRVVEACELKDHAELPAVLERNKVVLLD